MKTNIFAQLPDGVVNAIVLLVGAIFILIHLFVSAENKQAKEEAEAEARQERQRELWAEDAAKKLKAREFYNCYGVFPDDIHTLECQREILIRLTLLVRAVREQAVKYANSPTDRHSESGYSAAQAKFRNAIAVLRPFDEDLADRIPHWTQFPEKLDELMSRSPSDVKRLLS